MKKISVVVVALISIAGIGQAYARASQTSLGRHFQCKPAPFGTDPQNSAGFTVSTMNDMTVFFGEDRNDGMNSVRGTIKISFTSSTIPDAAFNGRTAVLGELGAKIAGNSGFEFMDLTFGKYKGWDTNLQLSSNPNEISYLTLSKANESLLFAANCSVSK